MDYGAKKVHNQKTIYTHEFNDECAFYLVRIRKDKIVKIRVIITF